METKTNYEIKPEVLSEFCSRYHIRRLSFFGSILRNDFGSESDIDVLIEFQAGVKTGLFRFARIQRELSDLFGGRCIDLRTQSELSKYFRDQVLASAQILYEDL